MGNTATSILKLKPAESSFITAINSSIFNDTEITNGHIWAENELRTSAQVAVTNWAQQNALSIAGNRSGSPQGGPGDGFTITVGIQLLLSYKIGFKAGLNAGYGKRFGNMAFNSSVHVGVYNAGLGTPIDKRNLTFDVTGSANLIFGWGKGVPLRSYSLNYNTPIPMMNDFKNSISIGQLFTWNSAINDNQFSFSRLQREGMFGMRIGKFNISTNNDTAMVPYFGCGSDKGWTGGISIATPWMEFGFQDFTGDFDDNAKLETERHEIKKAMKDIEGDKTLDSDEKKRRLMPLKDRLDDLTDNSYHTQSTKQKRLNKASTYFRFSRNGTLDIVGDAWFQNFIHRKIKDIRFEYPQKKIEIWGGKNW